MNNPRMEQHQDRLRKEFRLRIGMECQKNVKLWTRISNSCLELGWQAKVYKMTKASLEKMILRKDRDNSCIKESLSKIMRHVSECVVRKLWNPDPFIKYFHDFSAKYFFGIFLVKSKLIPAEQCKTLVFSTLEVSHFFVTLVIHQMFWSAMWNCDIPLKAFFVSHNIGKYSD